MRVLTRAFACGSVAAGLLATGLTATGLTASAASAASVASAASTGASAGAAGVPDRVRAPYADLVDVGTGQAMWSRDQHARVPMGSIAKVMTAYVVIRAGDLGRLITVPRGITAYDRKYGASTAGLKPGERLTARELLYALLIPSGCDAAYALATTYGRGVPAFIAKMNATAARLGLRNTHFTDASGLPDPTETSTYSTAHDLVNLGRDAMAEPLFASIVGQATYELPAADGLHPAFSWGTTNPLIGRYAGVTGIKTGDTRAAGSCLLFEATRNGEVLIGVVLDDPSFSASASDAAHMMDWGWSEHVVGLRLDQCHYGKLTHGESQSAHYTRGKHMAVSVGLDKALDKAYESKSISEILDAPVAAIAGVSDGDGEKLSAAFGIKTVRDLGTNKYFKLAAALVALNGHAD